MLAEFLESEPSAGQRLVLLCVFVAIGLVFSVQLSQTAAPEPLRWTRLTPETKPYWYTLYVLEAFLLVQNTYPNMLRSMETVLNTGYEDKILNAVWVGLLGLEILMVVGVAVKGLAKRVQPAAKAKTQ